MHMSAWDAWALCQLTEKDLKRDDVQQADLEAPRKDPLELKGRGEILKWVKAALWETQVRAKKQTQNEGREQTAEDQVHEIFPTMMAEWRQRGWSCHLSLPFLRHGCGPQE